MNICIKLFHQTSSILTSSKAEILEIEEREVWGSEKNENVTS